MRGNQIGDVCGVMSVEMDLGTQVQFLDMAACNFI